MNLLMENNNDKPLEYDKNLAQLLDEMKPEKEEMEAPPAPEEEISNELDEKTENKPTENIINNLPNIASIIVGWVDMGFASIASAISKTDNRAKYKLEKEDKDELIKAWKVYLQNTPDIKMSPSTLLIITMGIIYIPKAIVVWNDKKSTELEKENALLQEKIKNNNNGTTNNNE